MTKRMLIDATHHEETRVVVMDGNKLVEFDYESQVRRQLKGNIFLAKVTRVEPSLQAAFVNFGGNRHGFLPFAEIHPDYYRIPVADREALLAEQQALEEEAAKREAEEEEADAQAEEGVPYNDQDIPLESPLENDAEGPTEFVDDDVDDIVEDITLTPDAGGTNQESDIDFDSAPQGEMAQDLVATEAGFHDDVRLDPEDSSMDMSSGDPGDDQDQTDDSESSTGSQDGRSGSKRAWRQRRGPGARRYMGARTKRDEISDDGPASLHARFRRRYKIQEVIKRGQIMLIQVSKEERGNKGAAVTTYLSLPGRYCVLMPNSPRGGGVSRKIGNFADRRRLKSMLKGLDIPSGMSVILRTAGVERSEQEIQRDYDYLQRLWDSIREMTLQSTAPALIYEEGDLIKRSIRDIYARDVDELFVSGEKGYAEAQEFMGMLMPSHVDRVQQYTNDKIPLFHRYQVENQITEIGEPIVQLKSGGYIVINQTEALVAVDVNSGRATKERHIEETALKTNLEAAEEIARQLRLRDLGGLVVIDFIDMEDRRNNGKVERRLKDALASDRARIQVSRISTFGLLELSRQRLNPSLTEAQFTKCPHCEGFGFIRSVDSAAILALRALEDEGIRARTNRVTLHVPNPIALYILNEKRTMLANIEGRYGFTVYIHVDDTLAPAGYRVEAMKNETPDQDDDDDASDDENASETGPSSKPSGGRGQSRGRAKPVAMEQALENQDDTNDESSVNGNVVPNDDADTANYNRADVEPDGEQPGRNRNNRRGGQQRGRGRDRNDRPDRPAKEGTDGRNGPRGGRPRGRGGRDRYKSDDRPSNDDTSSPLTQQPAREPQPTPAALSSAPVEKPRATYFIAKRRPVDHPDGESTNTTPVASSLVPPPDTPPAPTDGPKKRGWWGRNA
jgi:ribonuclease E